MQTENAALFIRWDRPVSGQEAHSLELFGMAMSYFGKKQETGLIESFEPVLIGANGGDLNGYMLIRGTADNIHKLRREDEFLRLITKCNIALNKFGVAEAYAGEALAEVMGVYRDSI